MKSVFHIISLRTVKYSDRHNILSAYSRQTGMVSFLVPAGAGKEAARRRALLMPLGLVECVGDLRQGRDVMVMHDPRPIVALHSLHTHPAKSSIALFLAQVLGIVLREGAPDPTLFDFIKGSIELLDSLPADRVANFHLCFLYALGRHLGIEPNVEDYGKGMVFDMLDGRFRLTPPLHRHYLNADQAEAVYLMSRLTFANMHLMRITRQERNRLLDGIIHYYSFHYTSLSGLKSLDILRMLF